MDGFEHQLKTLVKYAQERACSGAFAMYRPDFLTVACFDERGTLRIIADTKNEGDKLRTFSQLYAQINNFRHDR